MIPHIEYHCDTEGCNARLFDIVSEQGVIEVKCPKCKQTIQVDVEELYETILNVASGSVDYNGLLQWVLNHQN